MAAIHNQSNGTRSGYFLSAVLVTFWRNDRENVGLATFPDGCYWLDPECTTGLSAQRPMAMGGHSWAVTDCRRCGRGSASTGPPFATSILCGSRLASV